MMTPLRALAPLALLAAAACEMTMPPSPGVPPPAVPAPPAPGPLPAACDGAALTAEFRGVPAATLAATTFANPVRIIRPGDAVTMDYNPDRINFELDAADRVARVTCG